MLTLEITTNLPKDKAQEIIKEIMAKFEAKEKSDSIRKWFDDFVKWLKEEKEEKLKLKVWDYAVFEWKDFIQYIKITTIKTLLWKTTYNWFDLNELRGPTIWEYQTYFR